MPGLSNEVNDASRLKVVPIVVKYQQGRSADACQIYALAFPLRIICTTKGLTG